MDTIQPLLTCIMVHQELSKNVCYHQKITFCKKTINGHHSATPDLYGLSNLCLVNTEYRSCVSRIQILCSRNADHRSCVSRMRILGFQNSDPRSCVSRMQTLCCHNRSDALGKYVSFEACLDKI